MSELVNGYHYQHRKLETLRKGGKLFRGCNGSVRIRTPEQLTAQVLRKSVWEHPE